MEFQVFCGKNLVWTSAEGYTLEENLGIWPSPSLRINCPSGKKAYHDYSQVMIIIQVKRRSNIYRSRKTTEDEDEDLSDDYDWKQWKMFQAIGADTDAFLGAKAPEPSIYRHMYLCTICDMRTMS